MPQKFDPINFSDDITADSEFDASLSSDRYTSRDFMEKEWDMFANYYYVMAVYGARSGNSDAISKNLKTAFSMDSETDLKNKAVNDVEFRNYSDAVQSAMN